MEVENVKEIIIVRKDGSGKFKMIIDVLKSIEVGNKNCVVIFIGLGEYKEKIKVERFKLYVILYGDLKNMLVLIYDGIVV